MPGPLHNFGPFVAPRCFNRRTALAQIGGAALACAAPALARPPRKKDHRMTWFALATHAGADGPRPVIQVGDAFHDLHDAAGAHGFAAVAADVSTIIRDWDARRDALFALARALDNVSGGMAAPQLAAPFEPRRIFAAASNFIEHAEEMHTKLAAKADSVVLLARWRKTPARAVAAAIRILNQSGVRLSGITLSQINVRAQAGQHYGNHDYDHRAYRKYYAA